LVVIHASGLEVSSISTTTDGITTWTETDIFISEGQSTSWVSWIFLSFAIANLGMIFMKVVKL